VAGSHSPCLGNPRFKPKDWCRKYSLRFCGSPKCARIPVGWRHSLPSRSAPKPTELLVRSILGDFWGKRGLGVVVTTLLSLQPRVKIGCSYTVASPLHLQRRVMCWPLPLITTWRQTLQYPKKCKYRCTSVSTGNTFQDLPRLRETAYNTESYIQCVRKVAVHLRCST
jgi:hypothetical protein